jgi:hypothetical protein
MMRLRMKSRFMKLFRLFRLKKYGEPLGPAIKMSPKKAKSIISGSSPSRLKEMLNVVEEDALAENDHLTV